MGLTSILTSVLNGIPLVGPVVSSLLKTLLQ
jgi:hypothetical protein